LQMHVATLQADGWAISYDETLGAMRLPPMIETVLYRIAQEALTNIRKHAQTTRVAVTLANHGQWLRLEVRDWGCGFDPAHVLEDAGLGERMGLRGMRERVALLGGHWSVRSSPGEGTLVVTEVLLPVDDEEDIA
jgi:signal transduction histidine kinase